MRWGNTVLPLAIHLGGTEEMSLLGGWVDFSVATVKMGTSDGVLTMRSLSPTGLVQLVQVLLPDENH